MRVVQGGRIVNGAAIPQDDNAGDPKILQLAAGAETVARHAGPQLAVFSLGCVHDEATTIASGVRSSRTAKPSDGEVLIYVAKPKEGTCASQPPEKAA